MTSTSRRRARWTSSRSSERADGGRGVDVVLDSLAREFVDASLRLLAPGGRFIEMGKTDVRDAAEVWRRSTRACCTARSILTEAGPERVQQMLLRACACCSSAARCSALPVSAWDVRRAPEAFRYMAQARHVGKIVLTRAAAVGGGRDGADHGRHRHARRAGGASTWWRSTACGICCCARAAGRAEALQARAASAGRDGDGGGVRRVAARGSRKRCLASIPAAHPLTAVIHTAGVLDDGVLAAQSAQRIDARVRTEAGRRVASARADARATIWTRSCCSRRWRACWAVRGKATTPRPTRSWMRWRSSAARKVWRRRRWRGATGRSAAG